ncbi:cupin domain-containing protein [Fulvivirga lutimaris]|uniref:cupin domain-containing protein n=1 Tax=Fulvivirga lutimaris TaxID=1819566 RepID=UPI0012BD1B00|nr:cupin domain-containing protein [Fulvivirga lutimaris]MTI39048.1 cupin domain-containing protein [Fulvivirga lutimaris]
MPFVDNKDLPSHELVKGFNARFVHTDELTVAYVDAKQGGVLPEHFHINQQVTNIIDGELEITVEGKTTILKSGMVAVIPSNAKHSAVALTDCRIIDVFQPVREDYKKLDE